jgi:hypothetical protein
MEDNMKVVDHIDTERVEGLTGEQRDDLFTKLIMGKDVIETAETSRGKFEVKFPRAVDLVTIGRIAARRLDYRPVEAFDAETIMFNMMASTLDVVVVSGPEWFEKAKKTNKNFSFLEVPSRAFISELYGKAHSFREKIEQRIDPPEVPADQRVPPEKGDDDAVDGGTFGGLSGEQGDTES